jgi:hypothetical protein
LQECVAEEELVKVVVSAMKWFALARLLTRKETEAALLL